MGKVKKTIQFLSKRKGLAIAIIFFTIMGAVFEGFSVSMIIPFFQSIISPSKNVFTSVPVLNKIGVFIAYNGSKDVLLMLVIFIFGLVSLKNAFLLIGKLLIWKLRFTLCRALQDELFDKLVIAGQPFFDKVKTGHMLHSFNRETELIAGYMFNFLNLTATVFQAAVYCAILYLISWPLCAFSVFIVGAIFPVIHFIRKKKENAGRIANKDQADLNFILMEILTGIRTIKLFIAENLVKKIFRKSAERFIKVEYRVYAWQELITPVSEIIVLGLISAVFIKAVYSSNINFSAVLPSTIAFMWILLRLLSQINNFNHFRTEMAGSAGAFDSYEKLLCAIVSSTVPNGQIKIQDFAEKIEFRKVYFSYDISKEVLKNINLVIHKGETVALVGISGAGKSTMVSLISKLYWPTDGQILVDNIDLKNIDSSSWGSRIGFVSQDVFIFNASVRENIAFGRPDASQEEVAAAAKTANIHDFILKLPEAYESILGEKGVRLSGGQKQRISIARAIIRNPQVLILDEATSSLDSESEQLVQDAISRLCANRTVIVIAHRLSTVQRADKLIVIENGEIIEQGTHNELLRLNNRYANLYRLQYNKSAV